MTSSDFAIFTQAQLMLAVKARTCESEQQSQRERSLHAVEHIFKCFAFNPCIFTGHAKQSINPLAVPRNQLVTWFCWLGCNQDISWRYLTLYREASWCLVLNRVCCCGCAWTHLQRVEVDGKVVSQLCDEEGNLTHEQFEAAMRKQVLKVSYNLYGVSSQRDSALPPSFTLFHSRPQSMPCRW